MTNRPMLTLAAVATLVAGTALTGPATAAPTIDPGATGAMGRIFMVNPVQSSGDQTLTDQKDSADAVRESDYDVVELRNLDGSGYLRGDWVIVESATGPLAYSSDGVFDFDRSEDQFEQVMGYFWIDQAQEYLQSLGFGGTLRGVMDEQLALKINQYGGDNSFQTTKPFRITLGKGGVDDAEDAEVIVHEYGHAVQADQVPGFGQSVDAGAIGEGFGDYFAVTVGLDAAQQYGWPVRGETAGETAKGWEAEACVADWDATSYSTSTDAKCLRRLDQDFTLAVRKNQVHFDGMIWSRALWDIRAGYEQMRLGSRTWDTTLIESQFAYEPGTSFQAAAKATYESALARDGKRAAALVKQAFADRLITF